MAELYVGTPDGVQKIGNGCTYPVPKGNVYIGECSITNTNAVLSKSVTSDALSGKSFIDVNISVVGGNNIENSLSTTIRVLNGRYNGETRPTGTSTPIARYYAQFSGNTVTVYAELRHSTGKATATASAYYYE